MSQILVIYSTLEQTLAADANIVSKLHSELGSIISTTVKRAMNADEGYGHKFLLQETSVRRLFGLLKLSQSMVAQAFDTDLGFPHSAKMYKDPYYHILLLVIYYSLRNNDELLSQKALLIILYKMWNGIKYRYIKFCDKRIMNYVVENMLTGKHLASKYTDPYELLANHFVPSLLKKYGSAILNDPRELKRLFSQSHNRLRQMFVHNVRMNAETGVKQGRGLLDIYMRAKANGLGVFTRIISDDTDLPQYNPGSYSNPYATQKEDIITRLTKHIIYCRQTYPENLISHMEQDPQISDKIINDILPLLHHEANREMIQTLLEQIQQLTCFQDITQIADDTFIERVKQKVVNASDPKVRKKINQAIECLVVILKKSNPATDFSEYDKLHKVPKRQLFIYGIWYRMHQYALTMKASDKQKS